MLKYTVPRRDIRFLLYELLDIENHYKTVRGSDEVNRELIDAILEEGAKFAENEIAPLFRKGDEEGCRLVDGEVITPTGYKAAYQKFVEGGWPALSCAEAYGGQGLPKSLDAVLSEMVGSANWSWAMYPGLSHGAVNTLEAHGTDEQKNTFLSKLVTGQWSGTMCLTEAHCGSDLGLLRTKAEPQSDGTYRISGTKIFISAGDHDLTENVVHIVLARLPDAPEGTKGISLFIVPKFLPDSAGEIGERNAVSCGALEHKMGINGSATCVMNFDGATGFLIGPPNKGLNCMFTFMNFARIGTALQGVCSAEASFQGALAYARERTAFRALSGTKAPESEADPIIVHPDIRRMLLMQKSFAEGGRALCYYLATLSDVVAAGPADSDAVKEADEMLAFLTPIAKAFLSEVGFEAANTGVQIFGGHGYVKEWGMEQLVRDARIASIYEGTTGIQALDLLGRKVLLTQGKLLRKFTKVIHVFCKNHLEASPIKAFATRLNALNQEWGEVTQKIGMAAMADREEVGAAAVDYLMYSGYVVMAYLWARMAEVSHTTLSTEVLSELSTDVTDPDFYHAKIQTAQFYFDRVLPRVEAHKAAMLSGASTVMAMDVDQFAFL